MGSYAEYKERKAKAAQAQKPVEQGKSAYQRYRERKKAAGGGASFEDTYRSYMADYQKFAQAAQADSGNVGYGNAAEYVEGRIGTAKDLRERASKLALYLHANQDSMSHDDYRTAVSGVETAQKEINRIMDFFGERSRYYAQWKTEDDYNSFAAGQKEYEDQLSLDLDAAQKEIDALYAQADALDPMLHTDRKQMTELSEQINQKKARLEAARKAQGHAAQGKGYASLRNAEGFSADSSYAPKQVGAYLSLQEMAGMSDEEQDTYFEAFRQDSAQEDLLYEAVNGNYLALLALNRDGHDIFDGLNDKYRKTPSELMQMEQDERDIFNYVYKTKGLDEAKSYLNYLAEDLSDRQRASVERAAMEKAEKQPFLSSLDVIATSPFRGQIGLLGTASDLLDGGGIENNADYNLLDYQRNATTGKVSQKISDSWAGDVGAFLYGTGMSMGESLARIAVAGGNPLIGSQLAFSDAAASTAASAKDRGLSDAQAVGLGLISGAAEAAMEKFSLETLLNPDYMKDGTLKYILKNAMSEGGEEVSTDVVNTVADILIAQDKSEWQTAVDAYKAQGMRNTEAFLRAFGDKAVDLALSGLGGAISGGVMAGGNAAINNIFSPKISESIRQQPSIEPQHIPSVMETGMEDTQRAMEGGATVSPNVLEGEIPSVNQQGRNNNPPSNHPVFEMSDTDVPPNGTISGTAGDGKTYFRGETVNIMGVASIKDGAMKLKLEDGRTVDAKEVEYGSADEAVVYGTVANLGVHALGANMLIENYTPGGDVSATVYAKGIEEAYAMGQLNVPQAEVATMPFASQLAPYQRQAAYQLGELFGGKQIAREQAQVRKNRSAEGADTSKGKVHFEGDRNSLNDTQKAGLDAMEVMSKALGVQFYVFESEVDENGNHVGANGWYDPSDGSIHIDLYAGNSGKGTMLFTVAHELTHFIRQWSPAKFKVLANVLMKQYGQQGVPVNELVQSQIDKAKRSDREISYDTAYEEVIADSMEAMLADGSIIEMMAELKQQDQSLWQKIRSWFKDLAGKLRAVVDAYKGVRLDSTEGRMVADMKDMIGTLEALYLDARVDASENYNAGAQKNTTADSGGVRYMGRDQNGNVVVDEEVDAQNVRKTLTDIYNGNYKSDNNYFPVLKNTPEVYKHYCHLDADRSFVMAKKKAYKAMQQKNKNQHALGVDGLMYVIENLGTPDYIVYQNVGEYAGNYAAIIISEQKEIFAAVQLGEYKDAQYAPNGEKGYYNTLITAFYPNEGYIDDKILIPENDVVYDKNEDPLQVASGVTPSDRAEGSSRNSIRNPEPEVKKKFSLRGPVERTKDLVALHNLTEDKLLKALDLGGFPMPSIAVTKSDIPHTNFGDITLVFGSETIDPKASRKNVVYSADAWTPTFPRVEFEADEQLGKTIYRRLGEAETKVDTAFRDDIRRVRYGFEDDLNRYGGESGLIESLLDNYGLKAAYLEETGQHVDPIVTQVENSKGFSEQAVDKYKQIIEILGTEDSERIGQMPLADIREHHSEALEKIYPGMTKSALRMGRILSQVQAYIENQNSQPTYSTVTDMQATKKAIDDAINQEAFKEWVRQMFSGIEKSRGVYNQKPLFTPSGNRRSFQQTHLPATLENIVKAMAAQNGGSTKNISGFNGIKTLRAGTAQRFRSIADMHAHEGRLQNLTEEQFAAIQDQLQGRMFDIIEAVDQENGHSGSDNSLIRYDIIGEILMEISEGGRYNVTDIQEGFKRNYKQISDETALKVKELLYDVSQMPVNIFEAKPERAVGFDEVKAAILPDGTDPKIAEALKNSGAKVYFYEKGDNETRRRLVNSMQEYKFSQRDVGRQEAVTQALEKENAKLREDVAELRELVKLQRSVTGGTKFTKTSVEAAARYLKQNANAKGDTKELMKLLNGLYEYIASGRELTWEGVMEQAHPAVEWLENHALQKGKRSEYAQDILNRLHGSRVYLDESQIAEAEYRFGTYTDYRRQLMGSIVFAKDANTSLDSLWQELSEQYPDVFDRDTTSTDMPGALADIIHRLRNEDTTALEYARNREMRTHDLLQQVYDSYWRVSTLYTVADVKQRQINRLKGEHYQRMNRLREQHRENVAQLKQAHRERLERVRQDYRERAQERERKLREAYQQSRQRGIESRRKTEMRHKIQKAVKKLNDLLLNETRDRHVPDKLKKAVAEALDAINMDTVGADERIAKYDELIARATDPDVITSLTESRDRIAKAGERLADRIGKLKAAYDSIKSEADSASIRVYDEVIANKIQEVIDNVGDTALRDMTLEQLEAVYEMYTMIAKSISNANRSFQEERGATIAQMGMATIREVGAVKGERRFSPVVLANAEKFGWDMLKPYYAFSMIGSETLSRLYDNVRRGEDVWAVDMEAARKFYRAQSEKYGYDSWDMGKEYSFQDVSGREFELNLQQIMSLYAYSKRAQADKHLQKGGFVFDSAVEVLKKRGGVPVRYHVNTANAYNLNSEQIRQIVETLTEEQAAFVDAMQTYLSDVMGQKGNEVSLALYDVRLFKEKNYFPLKSAAEYTFQQTEDTGEVRLKNSGFSKKTVPNASNPIVLGDFMTVWGSHVNDMSMYHAFVLPLEDFNRVYNYKTLSSEEDSTQSVKATLRSTYGIAATKYIRQMLEDINGGARADDRAGILSRWMGRFKKGSVFANASVVIQQPSAIARATALIEPQYFIGARISQKRHAQLWEEVKQYAPVAIIKEMGYFDTNMGLSSVEYLTAKEYETIGERARAIFADGNYRDEVLSRPAALADEFSWCYIWEAVKRETRGNHPEMDTRSNAFLRKAGERFTEVITRTQVYDSVLSRSGLMRSKDTGAKMMTAFMSEPTTSMNMVVDAIVQGGRGQRWYARNAVGAVVASLVLNSLLVSFVYAARDDDEEKSYWEKYLANFAGKTLDSLNPLTYLPFIKDIVSITRGYTVERSDMSVISDIWAAWQKLPNKNVSLYRKIEDFGGSIAQAFGLPLKNIMRDIRAIGQTFESFWHGPETSWQGVGVAIREGTAGKDIPKHRKLYEAMVGDDDTYRKRMESQYGSEAELESAVRKALREYDARICEAAEARCYGDFDEYERIFLEIEQDGNFTRSQIAGAVQAELNAMSDDEERKTSSKAYGMYSMDDFVLAVRCEDGDAARRVMNEVIRAGQESGKTEDEAKDAFARSAISACKKQYLDGNMTEGQVETLLCEYCGVDTVAARADMTYWKYMKFNPETDAVAEWFDAYYEKLDDSGIELDLYVEYRHRKIGHSKKADVMKIIDGMNLSDQQKDALYYAEGWASSTINEAPWHQ